MALITWKDLTDRYPEVAKGNGATLVNSNHLLHSVAELESKLSVRYTVPFSNNNLTAQDLAIDMTFAKIYRFRDQKKVGLIDKYIDKRIEDLLSGSSAMITTSGDVIHTVGGTVYSTTMDYHPVHGMSPVEYSIVDSGQIVDEEAARGRY